MRIVYLHQYFNTRADAGGTRSFEMARRLVQAGHTVEMITSDRSRTTATWRESSEEGIHVHWCGVPYANEMSAAARVRAFVGFAIRAARRAARIPADVIFATSTPLTIALPAVFAARRQGVPMVFEVRDLWPEIPIAIGALRNPVLIAAARWLERFAYRNSSRVIALSPGMAEGVVRSGYDASRVHVITNSSDVDLFDVPPAAGARFRARHEWLADRPLVVYAGTLGKMNGVSYLAELAAECLKANAEVRFLVVGSGAERELVSTAAAALGVLDRNFFMMEAMPKTDLVEVLSAADVVTSLFIDVREHWNNSANKFFDGLAAARPVAINYGGWQADILRESGAGLVLHASDRAVAAEQLLEFIGDRARQARASEAARRVARERFSRDALARELEAVLAAVAEAK